MPAKPRLRTVLLLSPVLTVVLAAYLPFALARRCWDWCRTRPDSVLTAALVGSPFFLLLAVAGFTK